MALRALVKSGLDSKSVDKTSVVTLYRAVVKELPRVMTIYDVDMPITSARSAIRFHFRKNGFLQDGRVIGLLIARGYMELEETLKQWKQKTHLLRILEDLLFLLISKSNTSYTTLYGILSNHGIGIAFGIAACRQTSNS